MSIVVFLDPFGSGFSDRCAVRRRPLSRSLPSGESGSKPMRAIRLLYHHRKAKNAAVEIKTPAAVVTHTMTMMLDVRLSDPIPPSSLNSPAAFVDAGVNVGLSVIWMTLNVSVVTVTVVCVMVCFASEVGPGVVSVRTGNSVSVVFMSVLAPAVAAVSAAESRTSGVGGDVLRVVKSASVHGIWVATPRLTDPPPDCESRLSNTSRRCQSC